MKRLISILFLLGIFFPSLAQNAESIMNYYIQAVGGRQALSNLTRIQSNYQGYYLETPLQLEVVMEAPNISSTKIMINGAVFNEQYYDGSSGYVVENGVRRNMSPDELQMQKNSSQFLWFLNYRALGITLSYVETIEYNFQQFHVLKKQLPTGEYSFLYFNNETGLLAQEVAEDGSYESYSNYQQYDGILIPINISFVDIMGNELVATLTNIDFGKRSAAMVQPPVTQRQEVNTQSTQTTQTQPQPQSRPSNNSNYSNRVGTGKKLALVIGNSNYQNAGVLKNPINDARAMASLLRNLGFEVILKENSTLVEMKKAVDDFGAKLERYEVGLFYYAGHGIQTSGKNYLIPVEANIQNEKQVEYNCIAADRVLAFMDYAKSKVNIIILDACRNNPFERSWSRSGSGSGLAFMNAPTGSIIAYATSPGNTASDGEGQNGLYTGALLRHMNTPGLTIEQMFKRVRTDVESKSNNRQTPWESTSLKGEFFFSTNE